VPLSLAWFRTSSQFTVESFQPVVDIQTTGFSLALIDTLKRALGAMSNAKA
jgi:hypothetical protein